MSQPITRRTLISGCLALGTSACLPTSAWASLSSLYGSLISQLGPYNDSLQLVVWDGLRLSIPSSFKWNDTGKVGEVTTNCSLYGEVNDDTVQVVCVSALDPDDFSETAWRNLLTCDLSIWIGYAARNDSMLGGFNYLDAKTYDNGDTKVLSVSGSKQHDGSTEKKICALAVNGTSMWYVCLISMGNENDDTVPAFVKPILKSVTARSKSDIFANNEWQCYHYVDKYDEPMDEVYISTGLSIEGKLSSARTVKAGVMVEIGIDGRDNGTVFICIRINETEKAVQGKRGGTSFTGSLRDGLGNEVDLSGRLDQNSDQIWLDDFSAMETITALQKGGRTSFLLQDDTADTAEYTFSLDATDNFREAYAYIQGIYNTSGFMGE